MTVSDDTAAEVASTTDKSGKAYLEQITPSRAVTPESAAQLFACIDAHESWVISHVNPKRQPEWGSRLILVDCDVAAVLAPAAFALDKRDLRGASLRGVCLAGLSLQGTNFTAAHLEGADLSGANLTGATLVRANLRGANLRGADLSGANLALADLERADLRGATGLETLRLDGANLKFSRRGDGEDGAVVSQESQ